MLFHKKTKKVVGVIWMVLSIIMVVGMILLYMPFLYQ
jgi:hypothetical protein